MKIAYFTPVNPQVSGISDYSEQEVIPYLAKLADIDIFISDGITPSNTALFTYHPWYPASSFSKMKDKYDLGIYNIGNNPIHGFIFSAMQEFRGVTILHDVFLHGLIYMNTVVHGLAQGYIAECEYCYGQLGKKLAEQMMVLPDRDIEFQYTFARKVIEYSLAVVCHSRYSVSCLMGEFPHGVVRFLPQPYSVKGSQIASGDPLDSTNLPLIQKHHPIISSFGFAAPHKRYDLIFAAFREFLKHHPKALLLLIGEDIGDTRLKIVEHGLTDRVILTGYIPERMARQYLAVSDFCINLRYPTAGEASRSVLEIMGAGRPVIVSDVGWFSELPDDCCFKVQVLDREPDILLQTMLDLTANPEIREVVGVKAKKYVQMIHEPSRFSKELMELCERVIRGEEMITQLYAKGLYELSFKIEDKDLVRSILRRSL